VLRTRTTVLHSHPHEWLGPFSGSAKGDYRGALLPARAVSCTDLKAKQIPPSQAIMGLDGADGKGCMVDALKGLS
jgi:hypothetical protein